MPPIKINKDLPAIAQHTLLRSSTEGRLKVSLVKAASSAHRAKPCWVTLSCVFPSSFPFFVFGWSLDAFVSLFQTSSLCLLILLKNISPQPSTVRFVTVSQRTISTVSTRTSFFPNLSWRKSWHTAFFFNHSLFSYCQVNVQQCPCLGAEYGWSSMPSVAVALFSLDQTLFCHAMLLWLSAFHHVCCSCYVNKEVQEFILILGWQQEPSCWKSFSHLCGKLKH